MPAGFCGPFSSNHNMRTIRVITSDFQHRQTVDLHMNLLSLYTPEKPFTIFQRGIFITVLFALLLHLLQHHLDKIKLTKYLRNIFAGISNFQQCNFRVRQFERQHVLVCRMSVHLLDRFTLHYCQFCVVPPVKHNLLCSIFKVSFRKQYTIFQGIKYMSFSTFKVILNIQNVKTKYCSYSSFCRRFDFLKNVGPRNCLSSYME